jgi:hypothetical protein
LAALDRPRAADPDFWRLLNERLFRLSNRVDPSTLGKLLGDIHSRVPMVTPDEQRAVQLENAKDDASFFAGIRECTQAP